MIEKLAHYMRRDGESTELDTERIEEPARGEAREYRDDQEGLRNQYLVVKPRRRLGDAPNLSEPTVRPEQTQAASFRRTSGA